MTPEPQLLAERISTETGLEFLGAGGTDSDGNRWFELQPAEHPADQTFTLRTIVGWRRIDVYFQPGKFAGELVKAMGSAGKSASGAFCSVLGVCREDGAEVLLMVNGSVIDPEDNAIWAHPWRNFDLVIRKGMLALNDGDPEADMRLIDLWTSRAAAAIFALLPLEMEADDQDPGTTGLPEGAKIRVDVNRYERDQRNRAAALAIHGHSCQACGVDLGNRYGSPAAGLIEVHHVTLVSEVGPGYIVDPKTDLVPLCPNCHSVAHRRSPPFSVEELRRMLG